MRICTLLALKMVLVAKGQQGISSDINVDSCTSDRQFFDSMQFVCTDCPANMKAGPSGLNCICDDSSILEDGKCTKC